MVEFAYNNSWQANIIMSPFKALFSYHPQMFYKKNRDPQSQFRTADENVSILRNLIKELKVNLTKLYKLQTLYHNKHVKKYLYRPRKICLVKF